MSSDPSGFQLARHQAEAYQSFTSTFMDGSARLLAEGAGIGPRDAVLDLACGTGLVARHVVPLVSGGGRVVGVDINGAMLEVARAEVGEVVEWIEAPCNALPLDDDSFTHVICQQGVQFFPDPVGAMIEARRVLRPGGTLVATVWATPGHNPYIESQLEMLSAIDPSLVPSVQRATPADADTFLRTSATDAGFVDIDITLLSHVVAIADFPTWFLAQTRSTPWGPTLVALGAAEQQALVSAMARRMEQYTADDGTCRLPFVSFRLAASR